MDDLKLYGKNDKEIDSLIKTVWQCSEYIKMELGILKCVVVLQQKGKKTWWEGIQLPNGEEIGEAGAGGYRYLGVLELHKIMYDEMKRKVKEVYQKRVTLLMKTHLNGKNLFQALNTWAISVRSLLSAAQEQDLNTNLRLFQINVGYVEHMFTMFCT